MKEGVQVIQGDCRKLTAPEVHLAAATRNVQTIRWSLANSGRPAMTGGWWLTVDSQQLSGLVARPKGFGYLPRFCLVEGAFTETH